MRDERAVARGRRVLRERLRKRIERVAGDENDADAGDAEEEAEGDVAAAETDDERRQRGDHRDREKDEIDVAGQLIFRAQIVIRARPRVGNFDADVVAADGVAVDDDRRAIGRAGGMNRFRIPREDALQSMRQLTFALRDELEIGETWPEKFLRGRARRCDVERWQRAIFRDVMRVSDHFAGGGDIDGVLLLHRRTKPSVMPPPQPNVAHGDARFVEAERPLEERLRVVVVIEDGGVAHPGRVDFFAGQNALGDGSR